MYLTTPMPRDRAVAVVSSVGTAVYTREESLPPIHRDRWHSWQFMLTVRGEGEALVDGRRLPIPRHAAVLLPRDRPHEYCRLPSCPHWEYHWVEWDGEQVPAFLGMLGLGDAWSIPGCADLLPEIEAIQGLLLGRGDEALHEAGALFLHALARIARVAGQHPGAAPTPVDRMVAWMAGHLDAEVSLADLAAIAGVSSWHCVRLFREAHGVPPIAYLRLMRLHRARTLLQSGDLGVRQIARAVGYAKVQHFTRMFTHAVGMSPRAFRAGNGHFRSPDSGKSG
jgi:AraC-like DNA-binding protein